MVDYRWHGNYPVMLSIEHSNDFVLAAESISCGEFVDEYPVVGMQFDKIYPTFQAEYPGNAPKDIDLYYQPGAGFIVSSIELFCTNGSGGDGAEFLQKYGVYIGLKDTRENLWVSGGYDVTLAKLNLDNYWHKLTEVTLTAVDAPVNVELLKQFVPFIEAYKYEILIAGPDIITTSFGDLKLRATGVMKATPYPEPLP